MVSARWRPARRAVRVCAVLTLFLGLGLAAADLSLAGRNLALVAFPALLLPTAIVLLWRHRASPYARLTVALVLVGGTCLTGYLLTGETLAQAIIQVPYHGAAVVQDGELNLREEIVLDRSRFAELNEVWERTGDSRLDLTEAVLSAGWLPAGTRDGDLVYQQVRVLTVADPRTMATIQIPVGVSWVDGLGEIRFPTGPKDIWTLRPLPDSTMEIRAPRHAIQSTFPPYSSIADSLEGQDVAVVPIADSGPVTLRFFGPLLANSIGQAVYPAYQNNLLLWLVGLIFLALGAVLNTKLQSAIERGWSWLGRRVGPWIRRTGARRPGGRSVSALELPTPRRIRERPPGNGITGGQEPADGRAHR